MEFVQAFFLLTLSTKCLDALSVLGVWFLCWYLRFGSDWIPFPKGIPDFADYSRIALPLMAVFSAVFHAVGAYRKDRIVFGFRSLKKVLEGCILGTLVFLSICYLIGSLQYSRLYLGLFFVLSLVVITAERVLLNIVWRHLLQPLSRPLRILLVGSGELLETYAAQLERRRPYPFVWMGRLGDERGSVPTAPYLGKDDRLRPILETSEIDLVVVSYRSEEAERYRALLEVLAHELVTVKVLPDFGRYSTFTYQAEHECSFPLLVFNQNPLGATDRFVKRAVDMVGAGAFLVLGSPLFLLIGLLVRLSSRGPVFYSQERVGADGRRFAMHKFRSMRVDAEADTGAVWATRGDDRVTPIGKWLRKTSLDEIPQFLNVLRGEMSLVGPRPERPVFVGQFRKEIPKYMLRHRVKSGITGWAQINGWRGNTSLEERIKHDLYYIGHWSHRFDLKILCLTVLRGFVHKNAY